jgi:hypothetical protein
MPPLKVINLPLAMIYITQENHKVMLQNNWLNFSALGIVVYEERIFKVYFLYNKTI